MYKYLFISCFLLCAASCGKKDSTQPTTVTQEPQNTHDSSYVITGILDKKMGNADELDIQLGVTITGAEQKRLTFSIKGLPENATAEFEPANGLIPFATVLKLRTYFSPPGTYKLTVVLTPEQGVANEYDLMLTVEPSTGCDDFLHAAMIKGLGDLVITNTATSKKYTTDLWAGMDLNERKFNLWGQPLSPTQKSASGTTGITNRLTFNIDCATGAITVDQKTISGESSIGFGGPPYLEFKVSGSGQVDLKNRTYEINYTCDAVAMPETTTYKVTGKLVY